MLNQNNEEFPKLARNSEFLLEFMGDLTIYADRKREVSRALPPKNEDVVLSKTNSPVGSDSISEPKITSGSAQYSFPTFPSKGENEKKTPSVAIWLGKLNGNIPEVVDKMLEAIGLNRAQCLFWADHDTHPVQLCQAAPEIRKVLVLASPNLFPKLKADAPLFHEGVIYLRSWDTQTLDRDIEAKKVLWRLMKTHFLNR